MAFIVNRKRSATIEGKVYKTCGPLRPGILYDLEAVLLRQRQESVS